MNNENQMMNPTSFAKDFDRRKFLSSIGKGFGMMALSSSVVGSLFENIQAATKQVAHLSPEQIAADEDFWAVVQQSFSVTRGIVNLNNGGVSPSPKLVTEAFVRYTWQQEDATAYTMWQILEPQSETIRTGLAEIFGCSAEEIAITRNASESRMLTTLKQREMREGLKLNLIKVPVAPKDVNDLATPFERAVTPKTKLILVSHQINLTGQIMPVKKVCEMARARGIETIVDGAHSFAQFDFKQADLGCDYFGTSLHKWIYAPKGTGMLYVRKEKIPKIWALMASEDRNKNDIRKFEEIGTHSAAMRLAIGEAILYHNAIGAKRKEARLRYLSRYWMNKLKGVPKIGFNTSFDDIQSCAIANVKVEGVDPVAIGGYLMSKHKIFTTPIVHEEFTGIRITPNVYTTLWELDRFCEQMEQIARNGLPKA
jgi:selenocysteine lyase/cysteine desulfurase